MKVLITTSSFNDELINLLKNEGLEIINNPYKRKITQTELVPLLKGVSGVIAGLEQYNYDCLTN